MNKPKFRAWDIVNKKMYQVYGWNISTNVIYICSLPNSAFKDGALHTTHVITKPLDNVILMQYTGLKDKNGVEIFEGDVVRAFSNINKISDPHLTETIEPEYDSKVVIYSNGAFVLSDDGKREYGGVLNHYVGAMTKDLEVIGNIHENPELLEVE